MSNGAAPAAPPADPHLSTYRGLLVLGGVGVPLAGWLSWGAQGTVDVPVARWIIAAACAAALGGMQHPVGRGYARGLTAAVVGVAALWFLGIARSNAFSMDQAFGLVPFVVALALLTRTRRELAVGVGGSLGALAAAYLGVAAVLPFGSAALVLGVIGISVGQASLSRARSEAALVDANAALESRVRERTAELVDSEREARRANAAKTVFLANMSHELRTPLSGILGHVELAIESLEGREPEAEADLGKARDAALHLLALIADLHDLSRIEEGHLELETVDVPLAPEIRAATHLVQTAIAARDNRLVLEVDPTLHAAADPMRLRQVLVNLLSNAAKFTASGVVTVRAARVDDDVRIEVDDTGVGMAPELVERLFQRFQQGDDSTTRRHGGTLHRHVDPPRLGRPAQPRAHRLGLRGGGPGA